MYSMSHHPVSASLNGGAGGGGAAGPGPGAGTIGMDGSGTINPAALNSSVLINPTQAVAPQSSPRGLKRSRSPDEYGDIGGNGQDDRSRKRGKPPKGLVDSPPPPPKAASASQPPVAGPVRTPQLKAQQLPQTSPSQASPPPPKATPTKASVLKALPTVRDHTTDVLTDEGDEYIPREYDDEGEKKVSSNGNPLNGRAYKCRTFLVPNRGDKLFMLATECARVLGYRDSYLLFNKNRSLYKIIATQAEKDDLIHQDVLPYSYRSRQIAIVTARSMFRQFGSRLIVGGRRVRDDYWEAKARKQGFTEEDLAGEKRPGAAKQREAAAAEASAAHQLTALPHGEIIYSNGPTPHLDNHGIGGINPATLAPLPMINLAPTDDSKRDYSNIVRPRHEVTGTPYQDKTTASSQADILNQSAQAADYNRGLGQQRGQRETYMTEYWKRPQEVPPSPPRPGTVDGETVVPASANIQSPHAAPASTGPAAPQGISSRAQPPPHLMNSQAYNQQPHAQAAMQSPMHPMHTPMRPDQLHHRSPSLGMSAPGAHTQQPPYGYPNNQMWPPQQPQPSPLGQHHNLQQYAQPPQQHSPHPQQSQLHQQSPQMHHAQSSQSMHPGHVGYQTMGGMGGPGGYPGMGRSPYQPGANPQQFMHQSSGAQQPGSQGWAPPPQQQHQQPQQHPSWQGF